MPPTDDIDAGLGITGGEDNDHGIHGTDIDQAVQQNIQIPDIAMDAANPQEDEVDMDTLGPRIQAQLNTQNL